MTNSRPPLPEFGNPPVFETVLGVQFAPLTGFSILQFGLYWGLISKEYPHSDIKPPLPSIVEEFPKEQKPSSVGIQFMSSPEARCWFVDSTETRVIQIQNDRYIHNWRKVRGDETYPRYNRIKPKFVEEWQRFCGFLETQGIPAPEVNQCEVSYVNHIEKGKGWDSFSNLKDVTAYWTGTPSGTFLTEPESVSLVARFLMPDKKGRLHIEMQPAVRRHDATEVLQLNLTARGKPASSSLDDITDWLDLAHEWVVRGFTDFTTGTMHRIWERLS